jgi:hypothetical protein
MSQTLDRAEVGEDVRTEASSIMSEGFIIMSDCQGVNDRLAQDPALKFQNDYLMERMRAAGLG